MFYILWLFSLVQFSHSLCLNLCNPRDCRTPGFPVHHQLLELTQTHVNCVGGAIQPSHPLLSPSPPAFNLSQHQGLFQWVNSSHQVAKVLEFQPQYQSFQWTPGLVYFRMDWLDLLAVQGTLESFPTPQFKSINSSVRIQLYSFSIWKSIFTPLFVEPNIHSPVKLFWYPNFFQNYFVSSYSWRNIFILNLDSGYLEMGLSF